MNSDSKENPSNETQTGSKESKSEAGRGGQLADYAPYPKLEPDGVVLVANNWSSTPYGSAVGKSPRSTVAPVSGSCAISTAMPAESNPYIAAGLVPASSMNNNVDKVKDALGKWGKKAAQATKNAGDLAGNKW